MAPNPRNIAGAAQRANNIVALLEYKPSPGIYSRLERAVQGLPENVRVQELPGLLKRYKDGIPGWELKAVDLDSVVAGRTTVPRDELLTAVRERSPVFTTREVRLSENAPADRMTRRKRTPDEILLPALGAIEDSGNLGFDDSLQALASIRAYPDWRQRWEMSDQEAAPVNQYLDYLKQQEVERTSPQAPIGGIGAETPHGITRFHEFKPEGATNYTELVFLQPDAAPPGASPPVSWMPDTQHHWHESYPQPWGASQEVQNATTRDAVSHMRFAEQGDALRMLESQSDLHNRNIKASKDGRPTQPYAMEQAQAEFDAKRLLLEAARQGKTAVEIARPDWIADTVGMAEDNAQHRYGKVMPADLERVARKLGGFSEAGPVPDAARQPESGWRFLGQAAIDLRVEKEAKDNLIKSLVNRRAMAGIGDARLPAPDSRFLRQLDDAVYRAGVPHNDEWMNTRRAHELRDAAMNIIWDRRGRPGSGSSILQAVADRLMPEIMKHVEDSRELNRAQERASKRSQDALDSLEGRRQPTEPNAGWRGVISDEMRKNIITKGIPAAVAIGVGTGIATGGNQAQGKPLGVKGRGVDGYTQTSWGLKPPGLSEEKLIRSLVKPNERRQVERLTKQLDEAYAKQDFGQVDDLEAQREQLLENLDSRLSQTTEDTEADFADWEPNDYEGAASNYEEQMRDIYASYVSGGPHFQTEAELANALRGIGPDTEKASRASDADLIQEAKAVFESRQAQIEKVKAGSPEDGVRAMQAQLRDMPAGLAAAPLMGQAQSVNENRELPTGSGGSLDDIRRGLVGEADFSMGISPAEWFAHQEAQKTDGVSAEHQKFQQNVADVMGRPIIRVGAANDSSVGPRLAVAGEDYDRITPAQFVGEYLDRFAGRMDEAGRGEVLSRVMSRLDGTNREPDSRVDDIVGRMMDSLKESSPKGKYAKMDPMPQEQFDALKQQHGDWAESMLTPGTAENFDSLRGYELLRTTLDGQHAPVYADNLSNAMTFASGLVDGDSRRDFHDLTFSSGPEGRFSRANRDYFRSAAREGEPAAFRDQDGTSRFASTGMNNVQGLMRAGGDTSNAIGAASWPLYKTFSEFTRTLPGKLLTGQVVEEGQSDSDFMAARGQAFDREQPIQPAGMSREMFDRQLANHQQDREQGLAWGATTYPNVQQFFGGDKAQKTWGPPAYNDYGPNFLQNTVGNLPSAGIMAASAATGGLAGLAAGAFKPTSSSVRTLINAGMGLGRGTAKGVGAAAASQAADLPFDTATDLGVGSTLAGPGNYLGYMGTPEQENALLPGVDPNSMSIEQLNDKRQNALHDRDTTFRDDKLQWFNRKNDRERAYDQWRNSR